MESSELGSLLHDQILRVYLNDCAEYLKKKLLVFVCFLALHPKSTAMFMAGGSVHLTELFPGKASTSG